MTSNIKRIIFTSLAIAVVVITAVVAVWVGLTKRYKAPSPLRCLPTWTTAVVRMGDRTPIVMRADEAHYGEELMGFVGGFRVMLMASRIDSLFKDDAVSNPTLGERDLYISFSTDAEGNMTQLTASFCLNNRMEWHHAMSVLKDRDDVSVRDTVVGGHGLFLLTQENEPDPLFLAAGGGCLFASLSPDLLVSFGNDTVTTMRDDPSFSVIERTVTQTAAISMYINSRTVRKLSRLGLSPIEGTLAAAVFEEANSGDWMALDMALHDDGVSADGFVVAARPSLDILLARESTSAMSIARRIPTTVNHYERIGAGARGLSSAAFTEYLGADSAGIAYRTEQSVLLRQTDVDVEAILSDIFCSELALCSYTDSVGEADFLVVDTRGGTMAQAGLTKALTAMHGGTVPMVIGEITPRQAMNNAGGRRGQGANVAMGQQVTTDISIPVYGAFGKKDPLFFLSELFERPVPRLLFFRYEDAIVFADNMETLRRVLADYVTGNTMDGNADYADIMGHFGSESSHFVFDRPQDNDAFGTVCQQLTIAGRLPYVSIYARIPKQGERDANRNEMWKIRLDTTVTTPLRAMTNHYTQLSECLVQDSEGKLNLIGADGVPLWKRAVDGQIVGPISQVDFYANGKLQYLFTTSQSLYIVDRLGNDVGVFPIKLSSPSVTGVSSTRYGDGSALRFFVGSEAGPLLYGPDGAKVEGWNAAKTEGKLCAPVRHMVCNGKDYIVCADRYGYYFLDRRGGHRLTPQPAIAPGEHSTMGVSPNGRAFVTSTTDGQVAMVDEATGAVHTLRIDSIGVDHWGMPLSSGLYMVVSGAYAALVDVSGTEPKITKRWETGLTRVNMMTCTDEMVALYDSEIHETRIYAKDGTELPFSPVTDTYGSVALSEANKGHALMTQRAGGEIVQLLLEKSSFKQQE